MTSSFCVSLCLDAKILYSTQAKPSAKPRPRAEGAASEESGYAGSERRGAYKGGEMAEWLKATVLKTVRGASSS